MVQTSARLLALLSLLQLRREWTGQELAHRLEVGPRTIRRDVDKLRSLGYPIEAAPGVAGGYRLGAGGELPPLLLDDAEAVAVAVGLRTAASGSISGIEETSIRALAKLEQVLPGRLRRRVSALGGATSTFGVEGPRIDAEMLATLAGACRDAARLRFTYVARDDRTSQRHAEPSAVVHSGYRWYLVAFDLDRDDWRTFRIDRIRGRAHPAGRGHKRTVPGGDPAAFVQQRLRGTAEEPDPTPGRIRVHAGAGRIAKRIPGRYATVEPESERSCLVSTRRAWSNEFLVWMALLGEPMEVLEPPELVSAARELGTRLSDAAATVPGGVSTFAVKFLGCKVSQADAMLARRALLAAGHREAPEGEADLHVVNTCCITREAEGKSRQSVRRSLKTAGEVYVSGCAVNLNADQFAQIDERVRPFVGTADDVAAEIGGCADLEHDVLARARSAAPESATRTRGFVKVQDGCDCHCAYCIIPAVRGAARSRPAGAVLDEVRRRVEQGQPEMVMTGISVGDYRDPEGGLELGELMVRAARVPGVERVRLSSVEVIHVKDSLLEALATERKVCPHLHVPMQSGDDGVLSAMGRHYDSAQYLEQIQALRRAVPGVNVTTDVIVGFPTESEAAFARTLQLIDAAGISRVHAFSYSPRPGTRAEQLGDRVSPEEKKRRSRELRGRSEARSRRFRAAKLGGVETVLVDKQAESQSSGYTADYARCYLPAGAARRGELIDVVCHELHADGIRCGVYPH